MLNVSICDFCYFIIFSHLLSLFVNLMMFNESTLLSRGAISCGVARTYCHTCRFGQSFLYVRFGRLAIDRQGDAVGVPPPVSRNASRLKHPGLHMDELHEGHCHGRGRVGPFICLHPTRKIIFHQKLVAPVPARDPIQATPEEDVALGLLIAPPKVGVTWRPGIYFGRELEGFSTNYWPHF